MCNIFSHPLIAQGINKYAINTCHKEYCKNNHLHEQGRLEKLTSFALWLIVILSFSFISSLGSSFTFCLFFPIIFLTAATTFVGCGVVAGLSEKSHEYKTLSTVVPCSL